ncbi:Hermansky-Pudlak syndrome 5 protein homolog [Plutella xylostella]|uniref:Hermansky-Pudlak syndrome 5 protein homolog n=1 Tax=Plutella xylostella TaxID=51655 RepID=UPI002032D656|nr:Hermansky-Pudlak syndrome 5 protein homolog [Plutella xylostella]
MSNNDLPLHLLQELHNLTESITYPLKSSQRIKYTCFDVSKTLIAFGATSGGIYIFNRNPCEFVQLIPSKDGAITRLSISPNEQHIGFANGKGMVTVTECEQSLSGAHKSVSSKEHSGNEVTYLIWSGNSMLFSGDDVGKVSVLQLPTFITKSMFQTSSQTIMSLDSRICQLDIKENMLLVSTLTRCYICDTEREQYRQIGQKLRDGEYGACFVTTEVKTPNGTVNENGKDKTTTEVKKFNIVDGNEMFAVNEKLANMAIFCARPSSRLWEASIDGTVKRTHQYKQVLARQPMKVLTKESYDNESVTIDAFSKETEGQSCNFPKIFCVNNNSAIVSYKKDAVYFLDLHDVNNSMWFNSYKDIVDCKLHHDILYLWLQNGSFVCLRFMKIEKYLVKCYLDEKYTLCTVLCSLYSNYLLANDALSTKLNILVGLRDKITDEDRLDDIKLIIEKFDSLKVKDATQMKSGIYVVDNTYHTQACLSDEEDGTNNSIENKYSMGQPEALQTLKDLSTTMTDKLNFSKKFLEEKWKHLGENRPVNIETTTPVVQTKMVESEPVENKPTEDTKLREDECDESSVPVDNDIIHKESSQKPIEEADVVERDKSRLERDRACKSLYQYFRISLLGEEANQMNLLDIIDSCACDIKEIYRLILLFEEYCITIGAFEEAKFAPNNIFLSYLTLSPRREELLDQIITDEILYKYFVESCISVNTKTQNMLELGCDCGFPLPYEGSTQAPVFSEIIDEFIERQWSTQTKQQCYDICKKMPYSWRKILYLRRNEDLISILRLLLQMLDEKLLHSFLPDFTLETWDRAIQLYAVLHSNKCLNCSKSFNHISVRNTLSWDDLGALMIKSIGGKNAMKVMEKHADLIGIGDISMKFYHTCFMVTLYEKYDRTIVTQLTDAIYSSYGFEDATQEICNLLRSTINGQLKNTALPLLVAAKSKHWGLGSIFDSISSQNKSENNNLELRIVSLQTILENLCLSNGNTDCSLCGLPLVNEVLIKDGGLWVFKCGHIFHGACLDLNKIKLCPSCPDIK